MLAPRLARTISAVLAGNQLRQAGQPGRVGVGEELFQFLIGFEDVIASQVLSRLDGLDTLRSKKFVQRGLPLSQWRDVMRMVMACGH